MNLITIGLSLILSLLSFSAFSADRTVFDCASKDKQVILTASTLTKEVLGQDHGLAVFITGLQLNVKTGVGNTEVGPTTFITNSFLANNKVVMKVVEIIYDGGNDLTATYTDSYGYNYKLNCVLN